MRADDPRQAGVGFTLAPEHQGYGDATEAVRRLLHYLLVERGKHRVSATCDDRNTRLAAVLERGGMRLEGHLLESSWFKGEWSSDLVDAVLRREWPTSRQRRRIGVAPAEEALDLVDVGDQGVDLPRGWMLQELGHHV